MKISKVVLGERRKLQWEGIRKGLIFRKGKQLKRDLLRLKNLDSYKDRKKKWRFNKEPFKKVILEVGPYSEESTIHNSKTESNTKISGLGKSGPYLKGFAESSINLIETDRTDSVHGSGRDQEGGDKFISYRKDRELKKENFYYSSGKENKIPIPDRFIPEPIKERADGLLRVSFSFSNTFVNLADSYDRTIFKVSAGSLKIKKSSSFAAYTLGELTAKFAVKRNIFKVILEVNGFSKGKKSFFRGLRNNGINISQITINPKLPHNGCRPPKARRI